LNYEIVFLIPPCVEGPGCMQAIYAAVYYWVHCNRSALLNLVASLRVCF